MKNAYKNTKIDPERSKGDISTLLKKAGIKEIQWTDTRNGTTLRFVYIKEEKGIQKTIGFEIKPPLIAKRVRAYNTKTFKNDWIEINDEPRAYRLLFWYLKNMLLAVEFGITSLEKVLLEHVLITLPSGGYSTIGTEMDRIDLANGSAEKLLALPPTDNQPKNITVEIDESKIIDVGPPP